MNILVKIKVSATDLPKDYRGMTSTNLNEIWSIPADLPQILMAVFFEIINFWVYTVKQNQTLEEMNEEIYKVSTALALTEIPKQCHGGQIDPRKPYEYLTRLKEEENVE